MLRRSSAFAALLAALALAAPIVAGCGRTITPAEIDTYGTRAYRGPTKAQTVKATSVALASLGYEVVLADATSGVVKTSPKVVQTHAYGSQYSATSIQDALAWSVQVTSTPNGSLVRAKPRAYRNGQPLDDSQLMASYMQKAFETLFTEIETNLPAGAEPAMTKSTGK